MLGSVLKKHMSQVSIVFLKHGVMLDFLVASVMVRSDTDVLRGTPPYTRSLSAPLETSGSMDDSILDIMKLQR